MNEPRQDAANTTHANQDPLFGNLEGLHERLSGLLSNPAWALEFYGQMSGGRMKPVDFALMCQAELPTIQRLHEEDPEEDSEEPGAWRLHYACHQGAQPGVVSYLAKQISEYPKGAAGYASYYPLTCAMEHGTGKMRPTEEDIKTIVERWPESLAIVQNDCNCTAGFALKRCLDNGYSDELFDFMLQRFPSKVDHFEISDFELDPSDTRWIEHVIPRVEDLTCPLHNITAPPICFLRHVFIGGINLKRLAVKLPVAGDEDDQEALSRLCDEMKDLCKGPNQCPRIQNLDIGFADSNTGYFGLLENVSYWKSLRQLTVGVENLNPRMEQMAIVISNLMGNENLQTLRINIDNESGRETKKRKRQGDDPLRPVFDALKTNMTITSVDVTGEEKMKLSRSYILLDLLKQNTSLVHAGSFLYDWPSQGIMNAKKIEYYFVLNRCGRKEARNPGVSLERFVDLLHYATLPGVYHDSFFLEHDVSNVHYGLLHEGISKWATFPS